MPRITVKAVISNKLGLHARPAMCFVDAASGFASTVEVTRCAPNGEVAANAQGVDGKSIMQMMMLAATKGTPIQISAEGEDAEAACTALKKLVESGFDED